MNAYDDTQAEDDEQSTFPGLTHQGRVLVAEDDPAMREMVVEVLHAAGHDVVEVASGEEMLQVLREETVAAWPEDAFGAIVTDHRMPNGNGLFVAERIRSAGCSTPILLITAFANEQLRIRADELDVLVMSKPFPLHIFRSAMDTLLPLHPIGLGRRSPWPS